MAYIPLLNPERKRMTKDEIRARFQEIYKNGQWMQLKREIVQYNIMREKIIKEMESRTDPVYRRFLNLYKSTMTEKEFERNRLKIYAICNRHAMFHCLPVDELLNMTGRRYRRY